ncbi:MAG: FliA/WhiG family RNA polymerase sigma factor [Pyrinomonadaceae bacterium]
MLGYSESLTYQKASGFAPGYNSPEARDTLIMSHLPKVKYIADRIAAKLPSSVERDDLYGAGVVGLIDAVEKYDASRGVAFTTFAELRVRGAILDNLRASDWASRTVRRRAREIQAAYAHLEQKNGGTVSESEVAVHMNIPISELRETLQDIDGLKVSNLDERDEQTGLSISDLISDKSISPLDELGQTEFRQHLVKAVDGLPERERQVIALYYVEELTMKEIGEVMGVTESRVSQLRSQAIVRLRSNLPK